jgi:hypothetical protein
MPLSWMTVVAVSDATVVFVPATEWISCAGVVAAKGWGELANRTGLLSVTPAVQLANDVRNPNASATAVGVALTANGVSDPNGSTTLSTGSFKYLRAGWNVTLTSGSSVGTGVVAGIIQLLQD